MNPKKKALLEKAEGILAQMKTLGEKSDAFTAEDRQSGERMQEELKTIRTEIEGINAQEVVLKNAGDYGSWLNGSGTNGKAKLIGESLAGETMIDERAGEIEHTGKGLISQGKYKRLVEKDYKEAFVAHVLKGGADRIGDGHFKVLQEGIDDEGGYLVPPDWTMDLIRRDPTPTVVSSLVRSWTTARDAKLFPKLRYTGATDDANANLYSTGVRVTYPGEIPADSTTIDATDPVTGQLRVDVFTAMMALSVTNDQMEDAAIDMEAFLRDVFQETINLEQDNRVLNGTGVGQARGILAAPSSSATADEPQYIVTGNATLLQPDGLEDLVFGLAPQYLRNARFVMSWLSAAHGISKMKDGEGNYLWALGNQDNRLSANFLTRPLLGFMPAYSEFMPAVAAGTFPIIFGDLMSYYLVNRIGFSIQVLRETKAKLNQIELVGRLRFGGKVAKPWGLKVQKVSA